MRWADTLTYVLLFHTDSAVDVDVCRQSHAICRQHHLQTRRFLPGYEQHSNPHPFFVSPNRDTCANTAPTQLNLQACLASMEGGAMQLHANTGECQNCPAPISGYLATTLSYINANNSASHIPPCILKAFHPSSDKDAHHTRTLSITSTF